MNGLKTVVFSHSQDAGYSSVNLSGVIPDPQAAGWCEGYIKSITAFSSNPRYLSAISGVKSFFVKDNFLVSLEANVEKDNRLFLENKVSVCTQKEFSDDAYSIRSEILNSLHGFELNPFDYKALKNAITLGSLSDRTTVYCITDDDKIVEAVQHTFFDSVPCIISRGSCIEVIGAIPEVKASVMICKCVDGADYEGYINTIRTKSNSIVIDFMSGKPIISVNISQSTYAQRVIKFLNDTKNLAPDMMDRMIFATATKNPQVKSKFFDFAIDKDTYFNAIAYYVLADNFAGDLGRVYATAEEKSKIEKYILS